MAPARFAKIENPTFNTGLVLKAKITYNDLHSFCTIYISPSETTASLDNLSDDSKNDLKIPTNRENKFSKTYEMIEELCLLKTVIGLNSHNTGKDELTDYMEQRPC